jgi:hypothetical protein
MLCDSLSLYFGLLVMACVFKRLGVAHNTARSTHITA